MTEPADVRATRTAYDTVAASYADLLRDELASKPLDRGLLGVFVELLPGGGTATVADLGCGPGRVTAHLHGLGADAFGIDLSPGMIDVARRTYPHLRFEVGTMSALDLPDDAVDGIVAWYSIIHTPPERLPGIFAEFRRILRPDGQVLLAFQVGDEPVHLDRAYGHRLALDAYRSQPDHLADRLTESGLAVHTRVVRGPQPPERSAQAYLLAGAPSG